MEPRYTTEARSIGDARNGRAYLTDGSLEIHMGIAQELGGQGRGANPEQLFAMGFATCFHQSVKIVAQEARADSTASSVQARVDFGIDDEDFYALSVSLDVSLPYVEMDIAREIAQRANELCPYSRATRGNIAVVVSVVEE
mgnify:CR=1 FL=1